MKISFDGRPGICAIVAPIKCWDKTGKKPGHRGCRASGEKWMIMRALLSHKNAVSSGFSLYKFIIQIGQRDESFMYNIMYTNVNWTTAIFSI